MALTHSIYDLHIDNGLSFPSGQTAGSVLAVNTNGSSYFTSPQSGPQGAIGPTGPQGPAGSNGAIGATGTQGPTGSSPTDTKTFITLSDASTITWNYTLGYNAKVTLQGNRTLNITNAANGDYGTLIVTQGSTGSYNIISWPSASKFPSGTYSFTSTGTASDIYNFVYDGTTFHWNYAKKFQ